MREFNRLLKKPKREYILPEERADYDAVESRTSQLNYGQFDLPARYFSALQNSPPLAASLVRMGTLVRQGALRGSYSDADRELVDIVVGTELDYNGIFTVHIPDAIAVGVRPQAIHALRSGDETKLTGEERHLAEHARSVINGTVTDESYELVAQRFGQRGALELTVFVGFLLMTVRLWQALGVPNPTNEEIDVLIAGLMDGSIPMPGPNDRIG